MNPHAKRAAELKKEHDKLKPEEQRAWVKKIQAKGGDDACIVVQALAKPNPEGRTKGNKATGPVQTK